MTPLYDHESEKWLIGALLTDAEVQKQLPTLPADLMHDPLNEKILSCMRRLQERREPIEPLSVQGALRDAGEPDMAEYLIGCMRFAVSGASAGHYIARLRGLFRARSAYAMASDFCRRLTEGEDVDACTDALRTALRGLDAPSGRIVRMDELASGVYDDVERRSRGEMTGILTGIPDLDRLIFCLEPGDLAVIGARPAVGKSAFGMQIALNAARQGRHVLVCSREMRQMQYAHRIAAHLSGINSARLRRGALSQEEWGELAGCCGEMGRLPLAFTFDSATVEELRVQAQREKELRNLDLLVVDYLQILRTSARLQKRYEAVGHVSRALKDIALDLQVPVVAMAQVGRQTVNAGGERAPVMPDLSDLRESGNIEQDADIVIFLHHPTSGSDRSIPSYDLDTRGAIEAREGYQYIVVRVAKQRQGENGSFGVEFDAPHMTYTCIAR